MLVADLNFWYFAATGENEADYLALMVLRQTGAWDAGYIPPYAVFILAVLIGPL